MSGEDEDSAASRGSVVDTVEVQLNVVGRSDMLETKGCFLERSKLLMRYRSCRLGGWLRLG